MKLRVNVQLCPWRQEDTEQREERNMQIEDIRSAVVLVRATFTAEVRKLGLEPISIPIKNVVTLFGTASEKHKKARWCRPSFSL